MLDVRIRIAFDHFAYVETGFLEISDHLIASEEDEVERDRNAQHLLFALRFVSAVESEEEEPVRLQDAMKFAQGPDD